MNSLARYLVASGLLLTCWQFSSAFQTGAQQPTESRQPAGGAAPATPASTDLDLRYAEAQLALARANLKRAESANQRVPNAVAASVVAAYKNDVEVARLRVEQLKAGGPESIQVWLRAAEVNWKLADARYQTALAANQRTPNTISPFDVERFRWRAEVCRLGFERGQAVVGQPREQQLEWRIAMLNDQIERLNEAVFRSPPTRTIDPYWWYW